MCDVDAQLANQGPLCCAGSLPNVRTVDLSENVLAGKLNMSELVCLLVQQMSGTSAPAPCYSPLLRQLGPCGVHEVIR